MPLQLRWEVSYTYSFKNQPAADNFLDWFLLHRQRVALTEIACQVSVLPVMLPHEENIAAFEAVLEHKTKEVPTYVREHVESSEKFSPRGEV
jgi:hypothetical protein